MSTKSSQGNAEYEEFLRDAVLMFVALGRCSASIERNRFWDLYTKERITRTLKDGYGVGEVGLDYFEGVGKFAVRLQETPESPAVVSIDCEFIAHLHAPEPISKRFVERFVKSELQLVLIPFARQFVASTTAIMGIPPLTLPLSRTFHGKKPAKDKKG
jgi:hypothetical protein